MIFHQNKFYLLSFIFIVLINVCKSSSGLYVYQCPYYDFQVEIHHAQLMNKLNEKEMNEKLQTAINLAQAMQIKISEGDTNSTIYYLIRNKFIITLDELIKFRLTMHYMCFRNY